MKNKQIVKRKIRDNPKKVGKGKNDFKEHKKIVKEHLDEHYTKIEDRLVDVQKFLKQVKMKKQDQVPEDLLKEIFKRFQFYNGQEFDNRPAFGEGENVIWGGWSHISGTWDEADPEEEDIWPINGVDGNPEVVSRTALAIKDGSDPKWELDRWVGNSLPPSSITRGFFLVGASIGMEPQIGIIPAEHESSTGLYNRASASLYQTISIPSGTAARMEQVNHNIPIQVVVDCGAAILIGPYGLTHRLHARWGGGGISNEENLFGKTMIIGLLTISLQAVDVDDVSHEITVNSSPFLFGVKNCLIHPEDNYTGDIYIDDLTPTGQEHASNTNARVKGFLAVPPTTKKLKMSLTVSVNAYSHGKELAYNTPGLFYPKNGGWAASQFKIPISKRVGGLMYANDCCIRAKGPMWIRTITISDADWPTQEIKPL